MKRRKVIAFLSLLPLLSILIMSEYFYRKVWRGTSHTNQGKDGFLEGHIGLRDNIQPLATGNSAGFHVISQTQEGKTVHCPVCEKPHFADGNSNQDRDEIRFESCPPVHRTRSFETAVNPHDFKLVQNEPSLCSLPQINESESGSVFLLILRLTEPSNFKRRRIHRKLLETVSREQNDLVIKQVFLIGTTFNDTHTRLIQKEREQYHDVLQEDFVDSYYNLTLKTIMGIKWASIYCREALWVMKADDDVYINFQHLIGYLKLMSPTKHRVIIGNKYTDKPPIRDPKNKWYVSKKVFPYAKYPPYVNGPCYVISGCLTPWLYRESLAVPYLPMEDVFVGILASRLEITIVHNRLFFPDRKKYHFDWFYLGIAVHLVRPTELMANLEEYDTHLVKNKNLVQLH
ncbi:beta-1,3-galactosyltransferase 5-like [Apostichopus japonicus]|uniref:beta-1,3-galactosyltransferase 5-like n=1 Tax=Stichopus japonicus TaxID=307972 RepID=UPI003AB5A3B1